MGSSDRPSKQDAFLALLREGWTSLHLDARKAGVLLPPHLKGEAHLVLQYGNDLPIPIPDLTVDEAGVSATLSFARTPHHTVIPWSAVYVVASDDGRGVLYHEDIPGDVSVVASQTGAAEVREPAPAPAAPRRTLRAVPLAATGDGTGDDLGPGPAEDRAAIGNGEAAAAADLLAGSAPPRRRRRPQLRLVK